MSWKRVGTTLLVLLSAPLLLIGLWRTLEWQLAPWQYANELKASDPKIDSVPRPAQRDSVKPLGQRVQYGGISVELPWPDADRQRILSNEALYSWKDGAYIELAKPPGVFDPVQELHLFMSDTSGRNVNALHTNCDVARAAFATTTDEIKWWMPHRRNAPIVVLLTIKNILQSVGGSGTPYEVQSGRFCGIQQGTPGQTANPIRLDLFAEGQRHYQITIHPSAKAHIITQPEVNGFVASLSPTLP